MLSSVWTLTLAAGKGTRLSPLTGGVPKQFWSPDGGPTLLEQTLERITPVSPADRRVTVVDASHAQFVSRIAGSRQLGEVVYQPSDRGTAAGVLLGLTSILHRDPAAMVLITPADHGIRNPDVFRRSVQAGASAIRNSRVGERDIVLFGARPAAAASDFGWITRVRPLSPLRRWTPVVGFCEKPDAVEARRLFAAGAVWNTMVLVGRAAAVFTACERCVPAMARPFRVARRLGPAPRQSYLTARYSAMARADFSRDVLSRTPGLMVYTWPQDIGWSDLGTPERLTAWDYRSSACVLSR